MNSVMGKKAKAILVPSPGGDLVPDGWAETVMLPWLREQTNSRAVREGAARLSGLEAYYRTLGADTVELLRARRLLDMRLGELLPKDRKRGRGKSVPTGDTFRRQERDRLRQLASGGVTLRKRILQETDEAALTRNRLLQVVRASDGKRKPNRFKGCTVDDLHKLIESGQKFGCIYADPPWQYGNQGTRAATGNHYDSMTIEQLCDMPIDELADDKALLHLWTTNAFLPESFKVIEGWGFTYKSCFVWVKPTIGIGNYWRVAHEFLLLGSRGGATFEDRSLRSWAEAPRGKHSAKPEIVRGMVEDASPGPYLELFGRLQVPGWSVWGNQVSRNLFVSGNNR